MSEGVRRCAAAVAFVLLPLVAQGNALSQEHAKVVETGVVLSAHEAERATKAYPMLQILPPFWTPSSEEIQNLEGKLKIHLEKVRNPQVDAIIVNLDSYKRQYLGYTSGGRRQILVNGVCEEYWTKSGSWRDQVVFVLDGGPCFFQIRYDLSGSQFERLDINGDS
jgi:hypothetical protein